MIQIKSFKEYQSGTLQGFADIEIPGWKLAINSVPVFQKNGKRWVMLPQTKVEKDGQTFYNKLFEFTDKTVGSRFSRAVISALVQAGALSGHLSPVEPTAAPKKNRKNPDKIAYRGWAYRPGEHPEPTLAGDNLPW